MAARRSRRTQVRGTRMHLVIGNRIGPYEIVGVLGAGGMGEVYRARDTRLDRAVAIKVLPERVARDPAFRDRFEREARTISRVNDPRICTIHDVGEAEGVAFIVMELVEGEALRDWIRRHPRPDVASITRIATEVAHALAAAHASGIVHRDIKPDNVMVRPDGTVKVLDFGVAKLTARSELEEFATRGPDTAPGMVVGTTEYMAPEQARGTNVDARADVFSLGVMLYEMLAGQSPFRGATATDTLVAILQHDPPPITVHRPEAATGLSRVVATCLEKSPERRYASGRELAADLDRLAWGGGPGDTAPPSIAVLPFVNMSADPENEYFCDGITEDLIGALTKIDGLHVAARTSSFAFKGRQPNLKEVGQVLDVRTALEGSVRKAGSRLRITAQLVNVADGYQVWSERYDRQLEDVFAIQDEISSAIVTALKGKLLGEEKSLLEKRHTENVEAFELYSKGRHHWHSWTHEGLDKASAYFQQAIAMDSDYALAYVGLADCGLAAAAAGLLPPRDAVARARPILARAVALDPELAEAWTLLGVARFSAWETAAAHEAVTRALELGPRLAHAHSVRACTYLFDGRHREGLAPALRSVELDPLAQLWTYVLMLLQVGMEDWAAADERARAALRFDPTNWTAHLVQGLVRTGQRELTDAVAAFEAAARCTGHAPMAVGALIHALARAGDRPRAERELGTLLERRSEQFVPAVQIAAAFVGLGAIDEAMAWLERSYEERDLGVRWAWWNPLFRDLRSEARMVGLLRRMDLEAAAIADGTLVR
jgi:eukaryotic-like serine/threonine-protein kinase